MTSNQDQARHTSGRWAEQGHDEAAGVDLIEPAPAKPYSYSADINGRLADLHRLGDQALIERVWTEARQQFESGVDSGDYDEPGGEMSGALACLHNALDLSGADIRSAAASGRPAVDPPTARVAEEVAASFPGAETARYSVDLNEEGQPRYTLQTVTDASGQEIEWGDDVDEDAGYDDLVTIAEDGTGNGGDWASPGDDAVLNVRTGTWTVSSPA
jgi:hypothetical protein